eukprot:4981509-Pleurochrysis_carterae.AAC.3
MVALVARDSARRVQASDVLYIVTWLSACHVDVQSFATGIRRVWDASVTSLFIKSRVGRLEYGQAIRITLVNLALRGTFARISVDTDIKKSALHKTAVNKSARCRATHGWRARRRGTLSTKSRGGKGGRDSKHLTDTGGLTVRQHVKHPCQAQSCHDTPMSGRLCLLNAC